MVSPEHRWWLDAERKRFDGLRLVRIKSRALLVLQFLVVAAVIASVWMVISGR